MFSYSVGIGVFCCYRMKIRTDPKDLAVLRKFNDLEYSWLCYKYGSNFDVFPWLGINLQECFELRARLINCRPLGNQAQKNMSKCADLLEELLHMIHSDSNRNL